MDHVLSADGVKPDPKKVEAIIAMLTQANREDLQGVCGCGDLFVLAHPNKHISEERSTPPVPRKMLNGPGDK